MSKKFPSLLVVSSCTGLKLHKPAHGLSLTDFKASKAHLEEREAELEQFKTSALLMYTGMQHKQVGAGYTLLKGQSKILCSLQIISAGYGLIPAERIIAPYETTFNDLNSREVVSWSKELRINEDLNEQIKGYDIIVFLLGENYLKSAGLPLQTDPNQSLIFLTSGNSAAVLPKHDARQAVMTLVNKDAQRFGYGLVGLKGFLFHQLARMVLENPDILFEWYREPQTAINALHAWQETRQGTVLLEVPKLAKLQQATVPEEMAGSSLSMRSGIFRSGLGYNPEALSVAEFYPRPQHTLLLPPRSRFTVVINNRDKLKITRDEHGEIRSTPLIDRIWNYIEGQGTPAGPRGFLTSLAYHSPARDPLPCTEEGNIYDCGAWSYKSESVPILKKKEGPLTPSSTMRMFEEAKARVGTDIIVSPDMLIMDSDSPQRAREKIEISLRFAREIKPLAEGHRLMAVTHGTFEQRHEMMEQYLEMGYSHIALGSLAMKSSQNPYFVYQCIEDALSYRRQVPNLYIHVLGVSSITWAATLTHLGVDSFDGSSMYMQAFIAAAFMRYVPDSPKLLHNYRVVENRPWSDELPPCDCPACEAMRNEGWDTRAQGGKHGDLARPYNGGNEANMGRAVHNINMYLRALQDVQARVLAGDEQLLVKRDQYQATKERHASTEVPLLV